ncbi:MAG: ABC transporter transmembrane and ATP binding protein [Osedax symbiont Rs1]|nr:MAG: ABC transporter transmembrane and ATP binding protein [Osedax symbiont Rs1]
MSHSQAENPPKVPIIEAVAARHKTSISTLSMIFSFTLPYRKTVFFALLALVFTAAITLSIGQGLRVMIDNGFVAASHSQLNQSTLILLLLTGLMAVGTYIRFYLVSWLGERVCADIRKKVFEHLVELHPSYFETNLSGEIMSRLTTDTTLLQTIIGSSMSMALRSSLIFIGALVMLLLTDARLTLVVFITVPFVLLPIFIFGRKVRRLSKRTQETVANVGTYAGEIIQQIKTVQSYSREGYEKNAFAVEVERSFAVGKLRIKQRSLLIAAVLMLVFSSVTSMLWLGGSAVLSGDMSAGQLGAFVFYSMLLASSVSTISQVWGDLQRAAGASDRLVELLQVQSDIVSPAKPLHDAQLLAAKIGFENVDFYYPSRRGQAALKNLQFSILPGENVALVGPSGAGKSTLFELIQRFYDPASGVVYFDGVDLKELDHHQLREQMALVPQQPVLFSSDVSYNIRYGRPSATDQEVIAAAKAAVAHDFIMQLPDQYKSYLGEKGVRLSGGQKQRIAIARAILKNPRILLLDEATSALDAQSEAKVQRALQHLMQGRTTFIIAHRLATILDADKIMVLDKGQIIAVGTHSELLLSCNLYKQLAQLQFRESV